MGYARRRLPHGETLDRLPPAFTIARVTFSTADWSLSSSRSGRSSSIVRIGAWTDLLLSMGLRHSTADAADAAERSPYTGKRPPSAEALRQYSPRPIVGQRARPPYTQSPLEAFARKPSEPDETDARQSDPSLRSAERPPRPPRTRADSFRLPRDQRGLAGRGRRRSTGCALRSRCGRWPGGHRCPWLDPQRLHH